MFFRRSHFLALNALVLLASISVTRGEDPGKPVPLPANQTPAVDRYGDPLPEGAVARLGTVRMRQSWMSCIAFSPDGAALASGGADKKIIFWDPATGKEMRAFSGHNNSVHCIAFSRDGKLLASGSQDGEICLWEVATGKELRRLKGSRSAFVSSVAFSPDGMLLASGGHDNSVRVWDVGTGQELRNFQDERGHYVHVVQFSPDGKILAAARTNRMVDLWDTGTWKLTSTLNGHQERVTALAFSPDGQALFTGGFETTVRVWEAATCKELRRLGEVRKNVSARDKLIYSLAVAPDGKCLAFGRQDGSISICDTATGQELRRWETDRDAVMALTYSPAGKVLAGVSRHGIRMWDPQSGKRLDPFTEPDGRANHLAFSPDGKILAAGYDGQTLRLFEADSRRERAVVHLSVMGLSTFAFSPDSRLLGYVERPDFGKQMEGSRVHLLDVASGQERGVLVEQPHLINGIAFSPRGDAIAGICRRDCIFWDLATGKERTRLPGPRWNFRLVWSPDARQVAMSGGSDEQFDNEEIVSLWDAASGTKTRSFGKGEGWPVAFSADGKAVLSLNSPRRLLMVSETDHRKDAVLWETATGQERCRLRGPRQDLLALALAPNGRLIATAAREETIIRFWSSATGEQVGQLAGHRAWVEALAFSPDGQTLVSGSPDSTILFWDLAKVLPARVPAADKLGAQRLGAAPQ